METMKPTDPVRIKNNEDREWEFLFDQDIYILKADAEVFWPWNVATYLLGDPTVRDTPSNDAATYTRLNSQRLLDNTTYPHAMIPWDRWEAQKPDIECFHMNGDRIPMAFQTPHNTTDYTEGYSDSDMKQRMAELQQQVANMQASMEQAGTPFVVTETAAGEEQLTDVSELPKDEGPERAPRRRAPPKKKADANEITDAHVG